MNDLILIKSANLVVPLDEYVQGMRSWDTDAYRVGWGSTTNQEKRFQWAVSRIPEDMGGTLLDIGCGEGDFSKVLKSTRPDIVYYGIDTNSIAIEKGRLRHPDLRDHLFVHDILKSPFTGIEHVAHELMKDVYMETPIRQDYVTALGLLSMIGLSSFDDKWRELAAFLGNTLPYTRHRVIFDAWDETTFQPAKVEGQRFVGVAPTSWNIGSMTDGLLKGLNFKLDKPVTGHDFGITIIR